MNHIGDTNKMVSDTPRTDAAIGNSQDRSWMDGTLCRQLERELNAANERTKRLEEYGNAMVAHVYCYRTQRKWTEEAYQDLIETIADWEKAKEAKP